MFYKGDLFETTYHLSSSHGSKFATFYCKRCYGCCWFCLAIDTKKVIFNNLLSCRFECKACPRRGEIPTNLLSVMLYDI